MHLPDAAETIAGLEKTAAQVVLVATGGGTRGIAHLASTPGASSVLLEGLVPYARAAIDRLLGGPQEAYCSSRTARPRYERSSLSLPIELPGSSAP